MLSSILPSTPDDCIPGYFTPTVTETTTANETKIDKVKVTLVQAQRQMQKPTETQTQTQKRKRKIDLDEPSTIGMQVVVNSEVQSGDRIQQPKKLKAELESPKSKGSKLSDTKKVDKVDKIDKVELYPEKEFVWSKEDQDSMRSCRRGIESVFKSNQATVLHQAVTYMSGLAALLEEKKVTDDQMANAAIVGLLKPMVQFVLKRAHSKEFQKGDKTKPLSRYQLLCDLLLNEMFQHEELLEVVCDKLIQEKSELVIDSLDNCDPKRKLIKKVVKRNPRKFFESIIQASGSGSSGSGSGSRRDTRTTRTTRTGASTSTARSPKEMKTDSYLNQEFTKMQVEKESKEFKRVIEFCLEAKDRGDCVRFYRGDEIVCGIIKAKEKDTINDLFQQFRRSQAKNKAKVGAVSVSLSSLAGSYALPLYAISDQGKEDDSILKSSNKSSSKSKSGKSVVRCVTVNINSILTDVSTREDDKHLKCRCKYQQKIVKEKLSSEENSSAKSKSKSKSGPKKKNETKNQCRNINASTFNMKEDNEKFKSKFESESGDSTPSFAFAFVSPSNISTSFSSHSKKGKV